MKGAGRTHSNAITRGELAGSLSAGLSALQVSLDPERQERLIDYLDLLEKWNSVYNLTAIRKRQDMLSAHLLDSLAIVPLIERLGVHHVLDVGAGAGLPGIPLAIALPALRVDLVDAVQKKTAFQTQVKAQLLLTNLHCHHARVEALTLPKSPDCIVSRAFSELADMVRLAGGLLAPGGVMVAMKGQLPQQEMAALPAPWRVAQVQPLQVPGLDAQRCAVVLERA